MFQTLCSSLKTFKNELLKRTQELCKKNLDLWRVSLFFCCKERQHAVTIGPKPRVRWASSQVSLGSHIKKKHINAGYNFINHPGIQEKCLYRQKKYRFFIIEIRLSHLECTSKLFPIHGKWPWKMTWLKGKNNIFKIQISI